MLQKSILTDSHGARSFWLGNDRVELNITEEGGHLAPVRFKLKHRWVEPLSLPPWRPDEVDGDTPPLLKYLRGDFFCLPFGPVKDGDYHGECANQRWVLQDHRIDKLHLRLASKRPAYEVDKHLHLVRGQRAIYQEHIVKDLQGTYNYGHHAIFHIPEDEGTIRISTSPFQFGQVKPDQFSDPASGEYGILKTGGIFDSLDKVPLATGGSTSLQEFPAREGYEDLAMITSEPCQLAWTAFTAKGYLWLTLKDPKTLPSTLFWISNGGRHGAPWQGRHRRRIALEEVCSYFCDSYERSRKNELQARGIKTAHKFSKTHPTSIRLIYAVHPVSANFGMVKHLDYSSPGEITVTGEKGRPVRVPVNWEYLFKKL